VAEVIYGECRLLRRGAIGLADGTGTIATSCLYPSWQPGIRNGREPQSPALNRREVTGEWRVRWATRALMALHRPPATGWLHKMTGQQVALEGYSGRPVECRPITAVIVISNVLSGRR
jgi:hypothetical protein